MKLTRTNNFEMNSRWIFWLLAFAAFFFALGVQAGEPVDINVSERATLPLGSGEKDCTTSGAIDIQ